VRPRKSTRPVRLAGGNPQIAKGYGEAPVRAYLAALPGWKGAAGRTIDALITRAIPKVVKAIKYNSPMYGVYGRSWFVAFHCFDRYIKVSFFHGAELEPIPPVASKASRTRYFHIHETDALDTVQFETWVKQASKLPGEKL
jgi:hypothetical protein